jgi:hypothetical protein
MAKSPSDECSEAELKELSRPHKCRCGGEYAWDFKSMGISHTYPTCAAYDDMDVTELVQRRLLGVYVATKMSAKGTA